MPKQRPISTKADIDRRWAVARLGLQGPRHFAALLLRRVLDVLVVILADGRSRYRTAPLGVNPCKKKTARPSDPSQCCEGEDSTPTVHQFVQTCLADARLRLGPCWAS
jgi:hypothetical protein